MRIQLYHQFYLGKDTPGGSRWNQFTRFLSEENGWHFDVLAGNINNKTGKRIGKNIIYNKERVNDLITVYRPWTYHGLNKNFLGRLAGYLSYTFSSLFVALFIKKPDVIIISSPSIFIGFSALIISKIRKRPLIFEVRDLWPESAITTGVLTNRMLIRLLYRLEKALYNNAIKIVTLTPAFQEDIIRRYPEYSVKTKTITNGADMDILFPAEKNNHIRKQFHWENKRIFMYIGAHGLANDLSQILKVAERFVGRKDIEFVLVGDGMMKVQLIQEAEALDLTNIRFLDSVPKNEVVHYLNAADVCMSTLQPNDTFKTVYPNKIFDYMCCKKPIISTIDGIAKTLLEDARCGYFASPGNIDEFEEAIRKIVNLSEQELMELGNNGYNYVKQHFNRKEIAFQYSNVIKEVI